jgi:hypothetical protein
MLSFLVFISRKLQGGEPWSPQKQHDALTLDCQGECQENHYAVAGMFQVQLSIAFDAHELDHIESEIEKLGQEFKRQVTRHVVEAADHRIAEVAQTANPCFHKHGVRPFTIVARYGEVQFDRQRLFDPKTRKTLIPSAIAWNTSNHRHLTAGLIDVACKESQQVSYRKASQNLADTSGQTSLVAASTVWNKKQQRGKELKSQQKQRVDKMLKQHEAVLVEHNIMAPSMTVPPPDEAELFSLTTEQEDEIDELFEFFTQPKRDLPLNVSIPVQEFDMRLTLENTVSEQSIVSEKTSEKSDDVILVQPDEVVTKSQDKGRKTNLTYTATVEDRSGRVVHLVAESSEALIRLIGMQLILFGLLTGKRLEVWSDGARWALSVLMSLRFYVDITCASVCMKGSAAWGWRRRNAKSGSVKSSGTCGVANIVWRFGNYGACDVLRKTRSESTT